MIRCERFYDNPDGSRYEISAIHHSPKAPDVNFLSSLEYATARIIRHFYSEIPMTARGTVEKYKETINHFKDTALSGVKRVNQITAEHIETHFDVLIYSGAEKATVSINVAALRKFFNILSMHNLIAYIDKNASAWLQNADIPAMKPKMEGIYENTKKTF